MLTIKNKRGQSILEYAVLIVIVIAALLSLQTYIKRGIQGRLKSATDDIGEQYTQSSNANYYKRVYTVSNTSDSTIAGVSNTTLRAPTITNSYRVIQTNADGEYWANDTE
ncbi:MAG: hypothetical protein V2A70_04240 [Candidatus Omnitrophota bacterium]